jgi:PTS system mannose-specific IIA component
VIGVVVVTHGQLATELLNAAEMIVGDLPKFAAVSIGWHDDVSDAREDIAQAIERVRGDADAGVLLLTDMFGGTPSNLAISCMSRPKVEVLAGINLPMLVKLAKVRDEYPLPEAVAAAQDSGRKYITIASRVLTGK